MYPDRHHPVFFLEDALRELSAEVEFARDERTLGCWGLIVNGKPMVWLIDNRHPHEAAKEDPAAKTLLERGALVCHAQKRDMERVGGKWLPLASSPGYTFKPATALSDVAFVGYIRDAQRAVILTDIASRYDLEVGEGLFGEEAVQLYRQARAGLNLPTGYGTAQCYDINMRVFEILATGTPLVTNNLPELWELGILHGVNAMVYDSPTHLIWLIGKLLEHSDKATELGFEGMRLIQAKHTYRHRAEQVLEWLQ